MAPLRRCQTPILHHPLGLRASGVALAVAAGLAGVGGEAGAGGVADEHEGVGQPTLSLWLRQAKMSVVSGNKKTKTGSRRTWSPAEKLRVVVEAGQLSDEELGALLRREGLHQSDLLAFREEALAGMSPKATKRGPSPEAKRIKELIASPRAQVLEVEAASETGRLGGRSNCAEM